MKKEVVTTGHPAVQELIKALGLPDGLVEFSIHFKPNAVVRLEATKVLFTPEIKDLTTFALKYELVPGGKE